MEKKTIVAFDLDGTLAESKAPLSRDIASLLSELLKVKKVAIISGATFPQFEKQVLALLPSDESGLDNLYLLAANGATFYLHTAGMWQTVYNISLSADDKAAVYEAFEKTFADLNYDKPSELYGIMIEDRGSQITFSGLGSEAPLELKRVWDPDYKKRMVLQATLQGYLPNFTISIGGISSIDITKGVDKAYGIGRLLDYTACPPEQLLFVGDAVFPGGNDYSVKEKGIETIQTSGPSETASLIQSLL